MVRLHKPVWRVFHIVVLPWLNATTNISIFVASVRGDKGVSIELLDSEVEQASVAKDVRAEQRQIKERIGKVHGMRILLQVRLGAYRAVGRVVNKFGGQVRDWLSTADVVVAQEAIVPSARYLLVSFYIHAAYAGICHMRTRLIMNPADIEAK